MLKYNKSSSNDIIINEYLKYTVDFLLPIYVTFFNIVLGTGIIPDSWIEGIIRPIYKNNGNHRNPKNYHPITILSCFGKMLTAVLNLRLNNFFWNTIIFLKRTRLDLELATTDRIFTLHTLTELLKSKQKKTLLLIHWFQQSIWFCVA